MNGGAADHLGSDLQVQGSVNGAHHEVGILLQHPPGEAQDPPPSSTRTFCLPAIPLEDVRIGFVETSVDLDRQLLPVEGDVDEVGGRRGGSRESRSSSRRTLLPARHRLRSIASCSASRVVARARRATSIPSPPTTSHRSSAVIAGVVTRSQPRCSTSSGGMARRLIANPRGATFRRPTATSTGPQAICGQKVSRAAVSTDQHRIGIAQRHGPHPRGEAARDVHRGVDPRQHRLYGTASEHPVERGRELRMLPPRDDSTLPQQDLLDICSHTR